MRKTLPEHPKDGDTRIRRRFLFLPRVIRNSQGKRELRWLERAAFMEQYTMRPYGFDVWDPVEWVDQGERP